MVSLDHKELIAIITIIHLLFILILINHWQAKFVFGNKEIYCQTSNISCTLVGNKIVDHSDAVGASLVGAAPTTFS